MQDKNIKEKKTTNGFELTVVRSGVKIMCSFLRSWNTFQFVDPALEQVLIGRHFEEERISTLRAYFLQGVG